MITVKTTLVATLADAINKEDKDTTIAELVEKYIEQAHNPEMMPKISEKIALFEFFQKKRASCLLISFFFPRILIK
jgi:hypothetical protein